MRYICCLHTAVEPIQSLLNLFTMSRERANLILDRANVNDAADHYGGKPDTV